MSEQSVVLVVDDEPAIAETYAEYLDADYAVRTAFSGENALAELDATVDVVLLDRRMPDLVGDEVLESIREGGLDARVAMVTAVDADFDIVDMEFDDYLVKPVSEAQLRETVDRLLRYAEYERKLREFYRVSRTHAALESAKSQAELENSDEFQRLETRRTELRAALASATGDLADEDFEALFRDLGV
jgi:DNA-binding response OmpR family regulator